MQWDHYYIGKTIPNSQIMILQAKITYFLLIRNLYSEQVTQKTLLSFTPTQHIIMFLYRLKKLKKPKHYNGISSQTQLVSPFHWFQRASEVYFHTGPLLCTYRMCCMEGLRFCSYTVVFCMVCLLDKST